MVDRKAISIILAYLMELDAKLDTVLKDDLNYILQKAPYLLTIMIEMGITLAIQYKMRQSRKRIIARNILTLLDFSQNVIQGMWKDADAFYQLPHMTIERLKKLRKVKKSITIDEFIKLPAEEIKAMNIYDTEEQLKDCLECAKILPQVDLKVEIYVDGEGEICAGDFVTQKFTITTHNIEEGENLGFIHSNKFPFLKQAQWYLVFTD